MTSITDQITVVARKLGVDPRLAIAMAQQESGLDPHAVGDHGTSYGLYQLHQGGELGNLTPTSAFDPTTNASVALAEVARVAKTHPGASPGQIAALAQRPADPTAYAAAVDAKYKALAGSVSAHPQSGDAGMKDVLGLGTASGVALGAGSTISSAVSGITSVGDLLKWLSDKDNWLRIGMMVGGFIVTIIGLAGLTRGGTPVITAPVKSAVKAHAYTYLPARRRLASVAS